MKKILLILLVGLGVMGMQAETFIKVTDASALKDGDKVVMAYPGASKVSGNFSDSKKFLTAVDATFADGKATLDEPTVLTLKKHGSYWNLYIGSHAVGHNSGSNDLDTKYRYTTDYAISIESNGIAKIVSQTPGKNNNEVYFRYNAASPRFNVYAANSTAADIELYILDEGSVPDVVVESVEVSPSSATLLIGKQTTLTATVLPEDADFRDVTWSSNNTAVATVSSSGVVKAIAAGTAIITATAGGKSGSATITVKAEQSFTLNMVTNTAQLKAGSKVAFANAKYDKAMGLYASGNNIKAVAATFSGDRGTMTIPEECVYTVETKNGQYAFKDANGLYLYSWSGNKLGAQEDVFYWTAEVRKTNIIISAAENAGWGHIQYNNSGACYSVYASAQEELVMYSEEATMDIEPIHVTEVKLNITELTLEEEETKQLKATVYPADTDFPDVTWSSSNENIASVSSTGLVTAKKAGNATITASTDGKSASCAVTVTEKPVGHGDYTLVKSVSNLKVGDIVVFGNATAQKTAYEFTSTYLSVTEAIIIGDNLDCDNAMEFTMGKDNNYWTFTHNGMLLGGVEKTLSLGGGTTQWTIDIYEGEAEIKPKGSDYVIQLNDDRFKLYAADSFYPCELYKRDGQGEEPHEGIDETNVTKPAQKVLRDGQLLIIRNGETYSASGARL
ncbi:MAG: Ig-like domain-containing protein [Paludibacteraceae bacterium]|nr:Ig-like domain-containing protein [Paludibacteraceae bacterium]